MYSAQVLRQGRKKKSNYRDISLLSIPSKVYGKVVTEHGVIHTAADWEEMWFQERKMMCGQGVSFEDYV